MITLFIIQSLSGCVGCVGSADIWPGQVAVLDNSSVVFLGLQDLISTRYHIVSSCYKCYHFIIDCQTQSSICMFFPWSEIQEGKKDLAPRTLPWEERVHRWPGQLGVKNCELWKRFWLKTDYELALEKYCWELMKDYAATMNEKRDRDKLHISFSKQHWKSLNLPPIIKLGTRSCTY